MLFRSYTYLDDEKIIEYANILRIDTSSVEQVQTKSASATLGTKGVGVSASKETSQKRLISNSVKDIYNQFEQGLCKLEGQGYYSYSDNSETYEIFTMPNQAIVKIVATISIPEEFDMVQTINEYRPYLMSQMDETPDNLALISSVLGNDDVEIPVILRCDDFDLYGKLKSGFLLEEYTQLEEYERSEVTILIKILNKHDKDGIEIYNPMKDFMHLNRTMRRQAIGGESSELTNPIYVNGKWINAEILAIYR